MNEKMEKWHLEDGANSHVFDGRVCDPDGVTVAFVMLGSQSAPVIAAAPGLLELAAEAMYERGRRDVAGRPRWDKLNPNEPYDMGMKKAAREMAMREAVSQ
jgi:hypothetical protein